jgi:hypothetical protein
VPRKQSVNTKSHKKNIEKLSCAACGEIKVLRDFYASYNPIHQTGRIPYCKVCLKKMISDDKGNVTLDKLKETLRLIDRPFLYDLWKSALQEKGDCFGLYMKNLCLVQNRQLGWKDSVFQPQLENQINYDSTNQEPNKKQHDSFSNFIVTDEIIDKWGFGYTNEEYYYFEKKWNKLIDNYGEKTSFHVEGLTTFIRFRVKEELATAKGDVKEAKEWAAMAKDAATAAKINVSQLSKSDISGGVDLVPQLFEAVESEVGIISILPKLKEQPYDDADLIIWCIINYLRRLEDKPRVAYRDIWNFYDEMLFEYYNQKGYSDEMIIKEKKKRNSIFRDLGDVYKEPIYEEGDN